MKVKCLALFLVLSMLLGACGTQAASSETSEETTVVDTYYAQWPDADETLTAVTDGVLDGDHLLFISDGRKIAETDITGTLISEWTVPLSEDQVLTCLDARDNGETALLRFNTQEERTELLVLNSDGELLSRTACPWRAFPASCYGMGQADIILPASKHSIISALPWRSIWSFLFPISRSSCAMKMPCLYFR
jgi:hypothetical protein